MPFSLIFLVTLITLSIEFIVTHRGPRNLTRAMKKGRTHRHMYRKAGVWWVVHSGGDAPAAWKLSTFIMHHWNGAEPG